MDSRKSDINRLLAALRHEKADRVPNFEILVDARSVSHILGRATKETLWELPPADAVCVAQAVGQDAIPCSLTWGAGGKICSREDLDRLTPPDPTAARQKLLPYLDAAKGTGVGVCARISGPLSLAYNTTGPVQIESFMYMLYDQPELVERLMDLYLDYHIRLIEAIADLPYHMYYIGDDISSTGGPLVSPKDLRRLWAPRAERLVKAALATGRPILFHCCGKLDPILPYLVEWGVNAVHPIQPSANDIYSIHARYGPRITLVGNMDIAGVLAFGTPDAVRADTCEHIERLGGSGGYVVCSSHSIIDTVPPENYLAMVAAAHEYGKCA